MGRDDYNKEWIQVSFDFFYWFARFEFALKENGYRMTNRRDLAVACDWQRFQGVFRETYHPCQAARALLANPPKRQILKNDACEWVVLALGDKSALELVLLILRTIRNNLFHGGKSSESDYDDPARNIFLLTNGKAALDQLSRLDGNLFGSYERRY